MISIDEAQAMLEEIAAELPEPFWERLNGGVSLLPGELFHPESRPENPLYILGEYHVGGPMGRYIVLYYGSFVHAHGHLPPEEFKAELKHTLLHEFTHHLESLGGQRDLEIEDELDLEDYREEFDEED